MAITQINGDQQMLLKDVHRCCLLADVAPISLVKPLRSIGLEDGILRGSQMEQIIEKVCEELPNNALEFCVNFYKQFHFSMVGS
ncbi:unnamed protein product [Eruca vesicaria subsp. sativa]|uniref:Uncharacterized protein n=1 Tax=Eruca vesicaria subsp. sativa TaxID=29727 RepID=A0ABC8JP04_ERUVS|nr:unnamed protein product [Eruca vesicaria subsp. sativa]